MWGSGCMVQGSGFRVQDVGCLHRVQSLLLLLYSRTGPRRALSLKFVIQESMSLKYEPVSVEVESCTDLAQLLTFSRMAVAHPEWALLSAALTRLNRVDVSYVKTVLI